MYSLLKANQLQINKYEQLKCDFEQLESENNKSNNTGDSRKYCSNCNMYNHYTNQCCRAYTNKNVNKWLNVQNSYPQFQYQWGPTSVGDSTGNVQGFGAVAN